MTATQNPPAKVEKPATTALSRIDERTVLSIPDLRKMVGSKIDLVIDALPEKMKKAAPRFALALITACQASPKLAECTAFSLLGCLLKAANLGLELGGECWLIPRKGVANFQVGWRGIVTQLYRNKRVLRVAADIVRKGDEFDLLNGTDARIVHKYGKTRGEAEAYYCVIKLEGGESIHKVMSVAEVDDHRKKFSEFGSGPKGERKGVWDVNFDAMALKTVIILGAKTAPKSVELPDDSMAEEVEAEPVDVLPAAAVQPRQIEGGQPGEVVGAGNGKTGASIEDLDTLLGIISGREDRESSDIEYEICQEWGVQGFADLSAEQRLQAFGVLERRAGK